MDNTFNEKQYSIRIRGTDSPRWSDAIHKRLRRLRESAVRSIYIPFSARLPFTIFESIVLFLTPSFLSPRSTLRFQEYKPNSTEWLDGLRGIAAFFVFIYHFVVVYVAEHDFAWDPVRHPNFIYLPVLRLFYSGTAMVRIFFVVSGFALTHKPARLMRKPGSQKALMKTIASSVFRRYLRLFLPCLGAFFIIHCARVSGAFDWFEIHHAGDSTHKANPKILPGDIEKYPAKSTTGFFGQMVIMLDEFWLYSIGYTILHRGYDFATDKHMWTIPREYMESMSLFLLVSMVAHIRREIRVYLVIPWCFLFWTYYGNFDTPLFISGYFLAELHADLETAPLLPVSPFPTFKLKSYRRSFTKAMHTIFWSIVAFLGLWLLSFPTADGENTFGYVTLCNILHRYSYFQKRVAWQSSGASILCLALLYLPRVQRWLSLPLFQYLGRISFSLYLMHGLVIRTMGHRLILEAWNHFNEDAHTERMFLNVMVFVFAILPFTIWLSDIFWRGVEAPATNFVRYLEGLVLVKEEEAPLPFKRS